MVASDQRALGARQIEYVNILSVTKTFLDEANFQCIVGIDRLIRQHAE
jgi:hypothetical protein